MTEQFKKGKFTLTITQWVIDECHRKFPNKSSAMAENFFRKALEDHVNVEYDILLEDLEIRLTNINKNLIPIDEHNARLHHKLRENDRIALDYKNRRDSLMQHMVSVRLERDLRDEKELKSRVNRIFIQFMITHKYDKDVLATTEGKELKRMMFDMKLVTSEEDIDRRIEMAKVIGEKGKW